MKRAVQRLVVRGLASLPASLQAKLAGEPIRIAGRELDPMAAILWRQGKREPPLTLLPPDLARRAMDDGLALIDLPPIPGVAIESRAIPGPAAPIPVRIYRRPDLPSPAPAIVYFHQGGCVIGSLATCERFCSVLADRARAVVVSVDYRLAPEHKFPAAAEDAIAAFRHVAGPGAAELGVSPDRVALAGDSAGGGLTAVVCLACKSGDGPRPAFQVPIYPWLLAKGETASYKDFGDAYPLTAPMMEWFAGHYLNSATDASDPRVSPLLADDFAGLPPALVVAAGFDPLHDEAEMYAEKLRAAGVATEFLSFDSLPHAFTAMSGAVPAAAAALDAIAERVGRALS